MNSSRLASLGLKRKDSALRLACGLLLCACIFFATSECSASAFTVFATRLASDI